MQKRDGMNYAPESAAKPVVRPWEFVFAATHLEHGHIYGQVNGLREAGGTLKWVYDSDPEKVERFVKRFPEVKIAADFRQVLDDPEVQLVASAGIPCERGPTGLEVLNAGKDYFVDKCPFTTMEQLTAARAAVERTGRKYLVYYSERVHNLPAWHVDELIKGGAIGRIVHISITGPHRLGKAARPAWFWRKAKYGGILTDIASHQFDQFLQYTGAQNGQVRYARVENFANRDHPEFEDFGEAVLTLDTGASCHSRVDWFTPDGLRTWGDGRSFIVGTEGYFELRKYVDLAGELTHRLLLADSKGEREINIDPTAGYPFFGRLILDILNRTETATTQHQAFLAAELSLKAQAFADAKR